MVPGAGRPDLGDAGVLGAALGTELGRHLGVAMVQDLVSRFSRDDLRDDMTILVARILPEPG